MDKCLKALYAFCRNALKFISLCCVGIVFLLNVYYTADVSQDRFEIVTLMRALPQSVLFLLVLGLLFLLTRRYLSAAAIRIIPNEKTLFIACAGVYCAVAAYLILFTGITLRGDAKHVFDAACHYAKGDYSDFVSGGYLSIYPNQLGLMTFDRLLIRIAGENPRAFFIVNTVFVIVTNLLLYQIADLLYKNTIVNRITLLFSFGFLPHLFFVLFAYGLLPGLCSLTAAFYFALCFERTQRYRNLFLMLLFSSLAVLLKNNYLIGVIAIALYLLLCWLRLRSKRRLAALALTILALILPNRLLIAYYESSTGHVLDNGMPTVLWIAMGTDPDNDEFAPGWYNMYNFRAYTKVGDRDAAAQAGMQKLSENLNNILRDPVGAAMFFVRKTASQWCEPMYQAEWSGPLPDSGQEVLTPLLLDFYTGGVSNRAISAYAKGITLSLWALSTVFVLRFTKESDGWEIAFLFFIGGLLFHMLWEGKAQYILPYALELIPFAIYAAVRLGGQPVSTNATSPNSADKIPQELKTCISEDTTHDA